MTASMNAMDEILLDSIPFTVTPSDLLRRLRLKEGSSSTHDFIDLWQQAQELVRPKALYRLAYIEERGDDFVWVNGIRLTSRILAVNLKEAQRVFPFIVTCGSEIEAWAAGVEGFLGKFWADAIMEEALSVAYKYLEDHLIQVYQPGHTSIMNPGSLEDWPLQQQKPLFDLFTNPEASVGVRLTESYLMLPRKSVSGLLFPLETSFVSCQLCPREICPSRRAPYDATLLASRYA